ncbi:MAG: hypothetical protein WC201_01110 [Bacilli bacterium]
MNKIIKFGGIYTLAFSISLATGFLMQYRNNSTVKVSPEPLETPGERLIASLLDYEGMNLAANIDFVTEENVKVDVDLDGQAQINTLDDIKLNSAVNLDLDGTKINAQLGYFSNVITLSYKNNYFKLESDSLFSFIDMLPEYGVNLELPSELQNIDINAIETQIESIEENDKMSSEDGYYYIINLGTVDNVFNIYVKTDSSDRFLGVRTDTIFYNNMKFSLNATIDPISTSELSLVDPLTTENASKYEDFSPAFTLFDHLYNFLQKDSACVNLSTDISILQEDESIDNYHATIGFGYAKNAQQYTVEATINENNRDHTFNFIYDNDSIYASFHRLKVSIGTVTISDLLQYAIQQIGDEKINNLIDTLMASMENVSLSDMADKISNFVGSISVGEKNLTITLDPTAFDIDMQTINAIVSWDTEGLSSIVLQDISYGDYSADVTITFSDFVTPSYTASEYVAIEPVAGLIDSLLTLSKQKQFRFEFDALVDKTDSSLTDITAEGGFQFDLDNQFGYGEMNIIDSDAYRHNIKADMRSPEEIIFAYNDTLKGKFNTTTLKELGELIYNAVNEPDAHMIELFGDLLDQLANSPIAQIIGGDYGLALNYDIIDNLTITNNRLTCTIDLDILGFDKTISLCVDYETNEETETSVLKDVKISGLSFDDATISFNVYVKGFDNSLDSARLDPYDEYLDFSDIKVLLELGINTSKFNYYHFTSSVSLVLNGLLGTDLVTYDLPMDIKIRNDKGNVKVALEFTDIPIKSLINPNSDYYSEKNRTASIYYYDDTVYVKRTEQVRTKAILGIGYGDFHTYTLTRTCDTSYFFDNILNILMSDVLGLSDTYLNLIEDSTSSAETAQIEYEKLLNDFVYNETSHYFYFDINLAELANDEALSLFTIKIYSDAVSNSLTGMDVHLTVSVGLKIDIDFSLNFEDDSSVELFTYDENGQINGDISATVLTNLDHYIALHSSDTRNVKAITVI